MRRWRSFFKQRRPKSPIAPENNAQTSAPTSASAQEVFHDVDEPSHEATLADHEHHNSYPRKERFWNKVKKRYQLVDFHALPEYLRGNEFILRHYRADWPLKETLLSIFRIHNETLNIWTHLIGFLLFLGLTIYTVMHMPKGEFPSILELAKMPKMKDVTKMQAEIGACFPPLPHFVPSLFYCRYSPLVIKDHTRCILVSSRSKFYYQRMNSSNPMLSLTVTYSTRLRPKVIVYPEHTMKDDIGKFIAPLMRKPTTRWPFFIFLGGAMLCLLTSTFCHLLCCHSSRLSYFLWRCDYAGISAMIATSFFPSIYYTFMCHPMLRNFYLISISILGVFMLLVTSSPRFQRNKYRILRTLLFCGMGICGMIPCIHKLMTNSVEEATFSTTTYEVIMGVFYGLGALFYATRIPERWMPGSFDIAGHSHQIFHILVVCGAYMHYKAALVYIEWRDKHGCD